MKINMLREFKDWDDFSVTKTEVKKGDDGKTVFVKKDGIVTAEPETVEVPLTLGNVCLASLPFIPVNPESGRPQSVLTGKQQQDRYLLASQINGAMKKNHGIADLSLKDDVPLLKELITGNYAGNVYIAGQAINMFDEAEIEDRKEKASPTSSEE